MSREPAVDAYIANAAPFAQPILSHVRELVHETLPEAGEAIKWGMPVFLLDGKMIANMAAFKAHASFGFAPALGIVAGGAEGMGSFGKLTRVADLPDAAALAAMLTRAAEAVRAGKPVMARKPRAALAMPDDLAAVLGANSAAQAVWDGFAPSHRREYIEWVTGAKRAETRERRIAEAVQWIAEGKQRNWKYQGC